MKNYCNWEELNKLAYSFKINVPRVFKLNNGFHHHIMDVLPRKLTWHLKVDPWKRRFLLETIIFQGLCSTLWVYFFINHLVERHVTGEKKASQLLDAINPLGASKVVSCFPHGHGELPTAGPTMPPVSLDLMVFENTTQYDWKT